MDAAARIVVVASFALACQSSGHEAGHQSVKCSSAAGSNTCGTKPGIATLQTQASTSQMATVTDGSEIGTPNATVIVKDEPSNLTAEQKLKHLEKSFVEIDVDGWDSDAKDSIVPTIMPGNGWSWADSHWKCTDKGQSLCSIAEICANSQPYGGQIAGDAWSPIGDLKNDWVQVGTNHHACKRYSGHYDLPAWGNGHNPYNKRIFCCGTAIMPGNGESWADSEQTCKKNQDLRLCSIAEMCANSKPYGGQIAGDAWSPIKDRYNDWVQVGTNHHACKRHSTYYGLPNWGYHHNPYNKRIFCCEKKAIMPGNGKSWEDSRTTCRNQGLTLCSIAETCIKVLSGGQIAGDAWSPIGDLKNDWVQVGTNHHACKRYSSYYDLPAWGNGHNPYNKRIFCCRR